MTRTCPGQPLHPCDQSGTVVSDSECLSSNDGSGMHNDARKQTEMLPSSPCSESIQKGQEIIHRNRRKVSVLVSESSQDPTTKIGLLSRASALTPMADPRVDL